VFYNDCCDARRTNRFESICPQPQPRRCVACSPSWVPMLCLVPRWLHATPLLWRCVCGALPVRPLVPPLSHFTAMRAVLRCGVDVRLIFLSRFKRSERNKAG
jgi:hypothetical protein